MSNEDKEIKVTDKRMFTADGKLREEYRFLDEKSTVSQAPDAAAAPAAPPPERAVAPPAKPAAAKNAATAGSGSRRGAEAHSPHSSQPAGRGEPPSPLFSPAPPEPSARLEIPGTPPDMGPSFYDLAEVLADPVVLYLGDVNLPDGRNAENLEMARLHLDLLDILRQKTAGNLTAQESAFLEDLLYRLRVRYVQKRG